VRVALYVTCLVDQVWPRVGLAAALLLRRAGCEVVFDRAQTCCGQPACNSGFPRHAHALARNVITLCERARADALVLPSGSCAAQIRHYPQLFPDDAGWRDRATAVAARTFELGQFLCKLGVDTVPGRWDGTVGWHDACHGLRDLGIHDEPRRLLRLVPGLELRELPLADACCGFGGTFAVKYPEISVAIADRKLEAIAHSGVGTVAAGDVSCLLHLRGRLQRSGSPVQALHLAELLCAGAVPETPP
jgi:L-lactate dehydrogenase complex protein LldE